MVLAMKIKRNVKYIRAFDATDHASRFHPKQNQFYDKLAKRACYLDKFQNQQLYEKQVSLTKDRTQRFAHFGRSKPNYVISMFRNCSFSIIVALESRETIRLKVTILKRIFSSSQLLLLASSIC